MKKFLFTGVFVALMLACFAQKPYKVVFYNFENLFDTINDPDILDDEFTPEGPKRWNSTKYNKKIANLEHVLFDLAAEDRDFPAVIGVSEIENRNVMEDVIGRPRLLPANYRIVHYDSPDARGVDVGFYYRPDVFKIEGSAPIPFKMAELPNFRTRDFVTMWGTIDGEPFFFLVSHWPSRLGGKEASDPKRMAAARQVRAIVDSVQQANPATKVVVMGDLNDDATDDSIVVGLSAKAGQDKCARRHVQSVHPHVEGRLRYAGLPRCLEPLRQHHRLLQPGLRSGGFAAHSRRRQVEILRRYFPTFLHVAERGTVQGLSAAYVRGQQLPGRFQRPLPRVHLYRQIKANNTFL